MMALRGESGLAYANFVCLRLPSPFWRAAGQFKFMAPQAGFLHPTRCRKRTIRDMINDSEQLPL